jgi:hypothetical protein
VRWYAKHQLLPPPADVSAATAGRAAGACADHRGPQRGMQQVWHRAGGQGPQARACLHRRSVLRDGQLWQGVRPPGFLMYLLLPSPRGSSIFMTMTMPMFARPGPNAHSCLAQATCAFSSRGQQSKHILLCTLRGLASKQPGIPTPVMPVDVPPIASPPSPVPCRPLCSSQTPFPL